MEHQESNGVSKKKFDREADDFHETAGVFYTKTIRNDTYPFISPSLVDMSGKTVFLTGASRGIGAAIAVAFTTAGISNLCLAARGSLSDTERLVKQAAKDAGKPVPNLLLIKLDVTAVESVEDAAQQVREKFGTVDILVNNAGYLEPSKLIHESDPEEWWKSWEINLRGPYLVSRAFLPLMLSNGGDRQIVNVSSSGALRVMTGMSAYNTSKLALLRFTEILNCEYGDKGILSYTINPGAVSTELSLTLPQEYHKLLTDTPTLPADTIVWLSSKRKEWLAGRYVSVQWDMEELEQQKESIVRNDLLKHGLRA